MATLVEISNELEELELALHNAESDEEQAELIAAYFQFKQDLKI